MRSSEPTTGLPSGVALSADPFVRGAFASVDIALPAESELHHEERALIAAMADARRATFAAGRQALRAALRSVSPDQANGPLLRTPRGAPLLPPGVAGSISHKRSRAVAIAAVAERAFVGVDLERRPVELSLIHI